MFDFYISQEFCEALKIDKHFVDALLDDESDWSFIIKCAALLEAATSQALVKVFECDKLLDAMTHLPQDNSRYGKNFLLYKMGYLQKRHFTAIKKFAELRNIVVHNVKNVEFNLENYVSKFNKDQAESWKGAFDPLIQHARTAKLNGSLEDTMIESPKSGLWIVTGVLLERLLKIERNGEHPCMHID